MDQDTFFTEKELASRLRISVDLLRKLRFRGAGPVVTRINSCVRYRGSDVEAWLASGNQPAESGPRPTGGESKAAAPDGGRAPAQA